MKDTIKASADRMTSGRARWPWTVAALIFGLAVGSGVIHIHAHEITPHVETASGLLHAVGDLGGPIMSVLSVAGAVVAWVRQAKSRSKSDGH